MIAIIKNGNLALRDGFMRLVKRNVNRFVRPPLMYRDGDGGHAMADLCARTEALVRKCSRWGLVAPYPREVVRGNTSGEQRRVATKYA
jgi:hypothetical protein